MDKRYRPSIFWALVLISIGVVLLLNTMHILPGNVVELILKLWPLLFIIGGLDNIVQGRGWVWAVISLGLGTIFLLANFEIIAWSSLSLLLKLWPLLLVAWGLDLIFQGRSPAFTIIGVLLGILIVLAVGWYAISNSPQARGGNTAVTQPLEGATSAYVRISNPVGRVEISGGAGDDLLLEGTVDLMANLTLAQDYDVKDGHGSLNISTTGSTIGPWVTGFGEPLWQMELTDAVMLTLNSETAAGSMTLDLTGLDIDQLTASVAIGSLDITLDPNDAFDGTLSNPIGKINISVPKSALVEITLDTAISTQNYPEGFVKVDNKLYSPNADAGNAVVRLKVEQPIGLVFISAAE